jgi:ABC-type transporter MlaC component
MKRLYSLFIAVALLLHGYIHAQQPPAYTQQKQQKAELFAALPDSFEVDKAELQKIFAAEVNSSVQLKLSHQLSLEGTVLSKQQNNPVSVSTNIRVTNYKNALLNVTVKLAADNSSNVQGRIFHPRYRDVLILYKVKDRYYIKKSSQELFMPE